MDRSAAHDCRARLNGFVNVPPESTKELHCRLTRTQPMASGLDGLWDVRVPMCGWGYRSVWMIAEAKN